LSNDKLVRNVIEEGSVDDAVPSNHFVYAWARIHVSPPKLDNLIKLGIWSADIIETQGFDLGPVPIVFRPGESVMRFFLGVPADTRETLSRFNSHWATTTRRTSDGVSLPIALAVRVGNDWSEIVIDAVGQFTPTEEFEILVMGSKTF
jgi:hypothetical protein